MKYATTQDGELMKVAFSEKLTFEDHDHFRQLLDNISSSNSKRCEFDLSALESIDSAGLGMLMIAHERSESDKWKLTWEGLIWNRNGLRRLNEKIASKWTQNLGEHHQFQVAPTRFGLWIHRLVGWL